MRQPDAETLPTAPDPYRHGLGLYHGGRYREAAEALAAVPQGGDATGIIAQYYRGMSYRALGMEAMSKGDFAEAERHLAQAARCLGREGDLPGYLACLYARMGRFSECLRETDKAVAAKEDVRAWVRHAHVQWRAGRRDEAQMTIHQALDRFGDHVDLHRQLGLFLAAQGRWGEAKDAFSRAVQADCSRADAYEEFGLAAATMGNVQDALRSFQRAYELQPHNTVLAYRLALAAKAMAQQGQPVTVRLAEPPVAPSNSQMGQLARYVTDEGDFVDAFLTLPPSEVDAELFTVLDTALQAAIAQHGDYADLHLRASVVLMRLNRLVEATWHARRAVAINGRYVRARLHLATLCRRQGRDDEALEHVGRAIAAGADWPDVHALAAELLETQGRATEARRHLRRARQLSPNYGRGGDAASPWAA